MLHERLKEADRINVCLNYLKLDVLGKIMDLKGWQIQRLQIGMCIL